MKIYDLLTQQADALESQAAMNRQVAGQLKAAETALESAGAVIQAALSSLRIDQPRGLSALLPKDRPSLTDAEIAESAAETALLKERADALFYGKGGNGKNKP